jgi:hypothetical protein
MAAKLRGVLQTWLPAEAGPALALAAHDPEVRSLCDDLIIAVEALDHWSASHDREAAERAREYRQIAGELTVELKEAVGKLVPPPRLP